MHGFSGCQPAHVSRPDQGSRNLRDFPGKRALRQHIDGQLEAALLADGVPPGKLYPIDLKRALDKIKSIKKDTIFWSTGLESQQLFRDKEVTLGGLWNTRAMVAKRESNGAVDMTFNECSAWVGDWLVPKGNGIAAGRAKLTVR